MGHAEIRIDGWDIAVLVIYFIGVAFAGFVVSLLIISYSAHQFYIWILRGELNRLLTFVAHKNLFNLLSSIPKYCSPNLEKSSYLVPKELNYLQVILTRVKS